MRLSNYFFYTLREDVKDEESVSGNLLTKAGLIKKVGSGIYAYTPVGLKVVKKIENIIREEMNVAGANEVLMSSLIPAEIYEESGRLANFGKSMFRFEDRNGKPMTLGPTHEELFTKMAYAKGNSYKNLPFTIYQIQTKFRDEARPRFGLIRVKEFVMKDAYSFDLDESGLDVSYNKMYMAYHNIFKRLNMKYVVVKADTGVMGGSLSEEFQAITPIGEDIVITCENCDFASNVEVAECKPKVEKESEEATTLEMISTPNVRTIDEVTEYMKIPKEKIVKTLIYNTDKGLIAVLVKGSREVNEVKVRKLLKLDNDIILADDYEVERATNSEKGFAGPVGLSADVKIIMDNEISAMKNFVVGANKSGFHYINVNISDFEAYKIGDVKNITESDNCPVCGGKLKFNHGVEVGNTFKLGTKYSKALKCMYLDKDNKEKPYEMGCYGIGVGRCLAALVEQNNDENGIIWATNEIAPFKVVVIPINIKEQAQIEAANEIYNTLISMNIDVLIDDRDERAGVKFKDADLLGIPYKIIVGKGITEGKVEFKVRATSETQVVEKEEIYSLVNI